MDIGFFTHHNLSCQGDSDGCKSAENWHPHLCTVFKFSSKMAHFGELGMCIVQECMYFVDTNRCEWRKRAESRIFHYTHFRRALLLFGPQRTPQDATSALGFKFSTFQFVQNFRWDFVNFPNWRFAGGFLFARSDTKCGWKEAGEKSWPALPPLLEF